MERVQADLPIEYQDGHFEHYNACGFPYGGHSYVFKLSPKATEALRLEARDIEELDGKRITFSSEGMAALKGLRCLRLENSEFRRIKAYLEDGSSFTYESVSNSANYFIPTLGVIVGGHDPN